METTKNISYLFHSRSDLIDFVESNVNEKTKSIDLYCKCKKEQLRAEIKRDINGTYTQRAYNDIGEMFTIEDRTLQSIISKTKQTILSPNIKSIKISITNEMD
jgi:hypothetical protein